MLGSEPHCCDTGPLSTGRHRLERVLEHEELVQQALGQEDWDLLGKRGKNMRW